MQCVLRTYCGQSFSRSYILRNIVNWNIALHYHLKNLVKISQVCKWSSVLWFLIPEEGMEKGDTKKSCEIQGWDEAVEAKFLGRFLEKRVGGREDELGRMGEKIALSLLGKERWRAGPRILRTALLMSKRKTVDVATAPTPCIYCWCASEKCMRRLFRVL